MISFLALAKSQAVETGHIAAGRRFALAAAGVIGIFGLWWKWSSAAALLAVIFGGLRGTAVIDLVSFL